MGVRCARTKGSSFTWQGQRVRIKVVGAMRLTGRALKARVKRSANKGMAAAGKFLRERLQATVGVQAPRRRSGVGWRALTPAVPGAPPRRVSGKGQAGISWYWTSAKNLGFFSRMWYMSYWETHGHAWWRKTIEKYLREAEKIAGRKLKITGKWTVARA